MNDSRTALPLVSVIIPFFNTEQYLKRCVDSIISQTYPSLEIILVDDGSSDQSSSIAQELAEKDSRIVNIRIENSGVSIARNTGLEKATGDYVMFADSDDWMDTEIIEKMMHLMTETSSDLVACDIFRTHEASAPIENTAPVINIYSRDEYMLLFFKIKSNEWVHFPVAKLYKKELLPNPLYPEHIRVGEDVLGTYLAIAGARTVTWLRKVGYYYYTNPESATSSFTEKDFDLITVWDKVVEAAEGKEPDHEYAKLNRNRINFTLLLRLLTEVPPNERKQKYEAQEKQLLEDLKKSEPELMHAPIVKSRKILIYLLCHCYPLMKFAGNLLQKFRKTTGSEIAHAQRRQLS